MLLPLLCWLAVGLVAGMVARKFVNLKGDDPRIGFIVGAIAAAVGGIAFRLYTQPTYVGPGLWSLVIAAITATAALVVWHMVRASSHA
jgi:uncharacterized membrane protein YeaQ/YmgE (transglycosylase-associated protein family)